MDDDDSTHGELRVETDQHDLKLPQKRKKQDSIGDQDGHSRKEKRVRKVVVKLGSDTEIELSRKSMKLLDEERERLENLVLGDGSMLLRSMSTPDVDSGVDEEGENESDYSDTLASPGRVPAWEDADDEEIVTVRDVLQLRRTKKVPLGLKPTSDYQKYLRKKFTDVYGEPSWAKLDSKRTEDVDPDLALLRTSGKMIEAPKYLSKGVIDIKKLASLNSNTRNEGIVKCVRFHPTTNVALVAGLGCTASIIQVDGSGNNKLASVHFERFPIRCARFLNSGNEFIVGSHLHSHFFTYDMIKGSSIRVPTHHNMGQTNMKIFEISGDGRFIAVAGRFGQVHLLTADSKEWLSTMSMNGTIETLCFSPDSKSLYTYGDQGEIYVWDVASRRLVHRFHDEGSIKGVSLAVSPCNTYIAAGSASGVVNLYETSTTVQNKHPTPLKAIMNIVTSATTVRFNHSSQILAIASDEKENAVKLVHLPSMTVFQNFPALTAQLHRIQDVSFSPSSGYLSLANNKKTAFLFRLKHFGNY